MTGVQTCALPIFEWRAVRSAAPTPDTAHPSRAATARLWPADKEGEEEDEEVEDDDDDEDKDNGDEDDEEGARDEEEGQRGKGGGTTATTTKGSKTEETKEFEDWFWENRGEMNRAWKRRRRTAGKQRRYRENRVRAERAV